MIAREVDFIEESLQPAPESEILDIGSGDGRHAIELAARGYRVTGFDRSLSLLVRAADAAQARDIKVNFVQSDFRELSYDEAFDAAYCISTTFGYFDDDLVCASVGVHPGLLRGIEPFPTGELRPYDAGYVAGWVVERYQIDLVAAAQRAREAMDRKVEALCAREIPVPDSLPRVIRVLVHWNTEVPQTEITHVYLRDAVRLRPDLVAAQ